MVAMNSRTIQAADGEQGRLDQLSGFLDERDVVILTSDDHRIEIPESLLEVMKQVVEVLREGRAVSVVPHDIVLTTQQAADYLGVSRPHLISILDEEDIAYSYTGTHRRIALSEIEKYRLRRDAERQNTLDTMTREAYEMGLYDVDSAGQDRVRRRS